MKYIGAGQNYVTGAVHGVASTPSRLFQKLFKANVVQEPMRNVPDEANFFQFT
jgi:hypothetical protein